MFRGQRPELIPTVPWAEVQERINRFWIPRKAPHISCVAQTRSGKSHLMRHGVLPLISHENLCIIDVKGDDPTLTEDGGMGNQTTKIPNPFLRKVNVWLGTEKQEEFWYRLIVHEEWEAARDQVLKALKRINKEGDWTIYIDETRALTDPSPPSLRLRPEIEDLWLRKGSRGICVVAGTQGPRFVPRSFYDQPQFHLIGQVEDEDSQKRLREIGGLERWHLRQIRDLPKYHFVYTDNQEDTRYRAITKVA